MKKQLFSLFQYMKPTLCLLPGFVLFMACSGNNSLQRKEIDLKESLSDIEIKNASLDSLPKTGTAEDDSIYTYPAQTAKLIDAIQYFRTHNLYKDWNPADKKQVLISAIIEKDGKPTRIKIRRSSDIKKLDDEALRLIRKAKINPALDENNKPVRSDWYIFVLFPPQ